MQAAILIEKLKIFPDELIKRNDLAEIYRRALSEMFTVPEISENNTSSWAQFTLLSSERERMLDHLKKHSVPSAVYYPKPLSKQSGYRHFPSVSTGTPVSHSLSDMVFSIPMHPYMTSMQAEKIISVLAGFNG